jgi:hypothetical protein
VEYPQLPPTVVGSTAFYVDPLILEEDPLRILLKLGRDALLRRKRMPNIVWLTPGTNIPAQGVDFGGLRRQLVTTLFHKLMQENSPITFQKDLQLPLLSDFSNQNEIDTYRTIGRLLAICAETSTLTGVHLHSNFFRAILALTKEEIDSISFDHPPSEEIQKKIFCELKGWSVSQWPPGADVLDYLEQEPIVYPVAIVAKEMQKTLGNKLQKWNRKGLKNFITSIQGQEVSITALREHLLFEGGSSSSEYERQIAAYLDSWMVHHSNELADLVELITSRRSLGREKITVEVYEHRKNGVHKGKPMQYFPIAHTCSTSIEIPYCATQEEFDKNIRVALKSRGTFEID